MVYHILLSVTGIWHGRRQKARIVDDLMSEVDVPYIVLCNHESFFDFHYIAKLDHPRNPAFVVNDYYCTRPVLKRLANASGMIGKKLFTPDFASTMDMLRTIRKGSSSRKGGSPRTAARTRS